MVPPPPISAPNSEFAVIVPPLIVIVACPACPVPNEPPEPIAAPEDQMKEKIQMFAEQPFLCPDKVLEEMREALYLTSRTTAISLNRNNGGVTFLTDGVITGKRVAKDYPEISSVFNY